MSLPADTHVLCQPALTHGASVAFPVTSLGHWLSLQLLLVVEHMSYLLMVPGLWKGVLWYVGVGGLVRG